MPQHYKICFSLLDLSCHNPEMYLIPINFSNWGSYARTLRYALHYSNFLFCHNPKIALILIDFLSRGSYAKTLQDMSQCTLFFSLPRFQHMLNSNWFLRPGQLCHHYRIRGADMSPRGTSRRQAFTEYTSEFFSDNLNRLVKVQ